MNDQLIDFKLIYKEEATSILEQCQGHNKKQILVIYKDPKQKLRPFLQKILAAIQLDIEQDLLVLEGTERTSFSCSDIQKTQAIKQVFVFGFLPQAIGLQVQWQKYQPILINDCYYLFVDELEKIEANKSLKSQLWAALQQWKNR